MADEIKLKNLNYTISVTNQNTRIKSILVLIVKHARNLKFTEDCELYVTIQLGNSIILKKSNTVKCDQLQNPIWNEKFEIEYFHTDEGICNLNGELIINQNLIICLWNQNSEDYLGQIMLNIGNLLFNCDNEFILKTIADASKPNSGSLVISFYHKIENEAQLRKYYLLTKKIFKSLYGSNPSDHVLLNCITNNYANDEYFSDNELNLLVKKVSNKYGIPKLVKYICHFNELVSSFWHVLYEIGNRQSLVFSKVSQNLIQLLTLIDAYYQNIFMFSTEKHMFVQDFTRNCKQLPIKFFCLLSNYRFYYPFNINSITNQKDTISAQLIELKEFIQLTSKLCSFCFIRLSKIKENNISSFINNFRITEELKNELIFFDYNQDSFKRILEICIKDSSKKYVRLELVGNDIKKSQDICNDLELEKFNFIIIQKLTSEMEIQNNFFSFCFKEFISNNQFDVIYTKFLVIEFLLYIITRISSNLNLIPSLRNDQIQAHLDIFISVKRIFYNKILKACMFDESQFEWNNFCQLFKPFLTKYIERQSDQFIKFRYRINDKYTDEEVIKNEESLLERKNIEKYYSCSVNDIFLKLNEILDVILNFQTKNPTKDSSYQLEYAKLLKNEVLNYIVCLKNEYQKCTSECNDKKFEIETCILINNLHKSIENIEEIKIRLGVESSNDAYEHFKSLITVINEDLVEIIRNLSKKFSVTISTSCYDFIQKISKNCTKSENFETKVLSFLNESIFKSLDEKLFICQHILFSKMFKQVTGVVFKITIKILEALILYNQPKKSGLTKINRTLLCMSVNSLDEFIQKNEVLEAILRSSLHNIVNYFSENEKYLTARCLLKTKEYSNMMKTLDFLMMDNNELISLFIEMESTVDTKAIGRLNTSIEVHQDSKKVDTWVFKIKVPKMTLEFDESRVAPMIEVTSISPDIQEKGFLTKIFRNMNFDNGFKELSEFRISFNRENIDKLKHYQFNFIVKNSRNGCKIATSVLSLYDIFKCEFNKEFYISLWIPLKFKLKVNLESLKILEVLEKRKNIKSIRNFVNIKKLCLS